MGKSVKNNRRKSSIHKVKQNRQGSFRSRYIKPDVQDEQARKAWDTTKTLNQNLKVLGLNRNTNDVGGRAHRQRECDRSAAGETIEVEWLDAQPTGPKRGMLFMTVEEQRYLRVLVEKYGTDYQKMSMDIKNPL